MRKYNLAAESAILDYEALRSDIMRITPQYGGNCVVKSGGINEADLAGAVARLESAANKVLRNIERYADAKAEVVEIISAMGEWPDEMECLRLRYLTYRDNKDWRLLSWDDVADRMYVSRRQATYVHGRALLHFQQLWNEIHNRL